MAEFTSKRVHLAVGDLTGDEGHTGPVIGGQVSYIEDSLWFEPKSRAIEAYIVVGYWGVFLGVRIGGAR